PNPPNPLPPDPPNPLPPDPPDITNPPISEDPVNPPISQDTVNPPISQDTGNPPISQDTAISSSPSDNGEANSPQPGAKPVEVAQDSSPAESEAGVTWAETTFTHQFESYLGLEASQPITLTNAREILQKVEESTGVKPAIIYAMFTPASATLEKPSDNSNDRLELVIVTAKGQPIRKSIGVNRAEVLKVVEAFQSGVTNVRDNRSYLAPAKQLYQWLVQPLEGDLQTQEIQNLVFVMDVGLRSLAVAALHDGKQFLVERYSIGLMPSLTLTDTRYQDIKNAQVLAMGADQFTDQKPLPGVPVELAAITQRLWKGKSFLDDKFTLENLKYQRTQRPYGIIHLATHADFNPGAPSNSYIQLWNSKLHLNELPQLGLNNPPVALLVLSACRTALGDEEAELGFAGLAVKAGVKSALASLWYISDVGTVGLMSQFYGDLDTAPIKAQALQQAQVAMIKGKVRVENGQLLTTSGTMLLPSEIGQSRELTHPYYWAAFTLVGNPW
ncbi:CHAT domain-containing protein, partial [Limnofasciculus baicalensis]